MGQLGTGRSGTGWSRTGRLQKKVAADPPFFNWFEISKFDQNLKHIYNSSICKEYKVKNTSQNTSQVKSEYKSI